ncbi:MAG: N-acetylmuramoyl-L-alanine amidase [Candidatus Acidiferrales bacterium]
MAARELVPRGWAESFDMLLNVQISSRNVILLVGWVLPVFLAAVALHSSSQTSTQNPPAAATQAPVPQPAPAQAALVPPAAGQTQRGGLSVVVLDPAHGGTDPGARGTGGLRESDLVLEFSDSTRRALEAQGFRVRQTRQGNDDPSLDDRSAMANAQRGTVFITLHVSSTGLPGTVRVYIMTDFPAETNTTEMLSWDRAQAPFLELSRKLGNLVQGQLAQQFKGSPGTSQSAAVRQLRTTAAPAIAVEVSSVTVDDRAALEHMAPGVADAIARGVAAFRPIYDASPAAGALP